MTESGRKELLLHCYRLLGSLTDAEDVLQETLLAAWRGLDGFEGRASARSWLYRIATNRCLNALRDRGRRIPPAPTPPFQPPEPSRHGDVPWLQPYPEVLLEHVPDAEPGPEARFTAREGIELAFVAVLQRLPPRQAAVLVLCDVLGYPLGEVAPMLDSTPIAVKGLLQRARTSLGRHRGDVHTARAAHGEPPAPGSAQDAAWSAASPRPSPPMTSTRWWPCSPTTHGSPCHRPRTSTTVSRRSPRSCGRVPHGVRMVSCGCVRPAPTGSRHSAFITSAPSNDPPGLIVLTLTGERIHGITRFLDDQVLHHFAEVGQEGAT